MSDTTDAGGHGTSPDELAELREAVAQLRRGLDRFGGPDETDAVRPPAPAGPLESLAESVRAWLAEVDVIDLWDELRRRLSAAGGRGEHLPSTDDYGLDAEALARARRLLDFLYERWWRVEVVDARQVPDAPGLLFVSNRSGILPYDGLMIAHAVERESPRHQRPRFLVADWLVTLPFSQPLLARLGGVRACQENAERLLGAGESVVAFPEGQKGALKLFRDRYRLARFGRGGFVSLAVRRRATVVPVGVVGAEETHPVLFRSALVERLLGVPLPVTPTFPHLGPLGLIPLPSRWRIRFGEPIRFDAGPPERADDPLFVNRARERVRGAIRALVEEEVARRSGVFRA